MKRVPFLDLSLQNEPLREELNGALRRVIESGHFILGPEVEAFEEAFAEFCGVRHAVALNSGTSALHLGLLALGVEPGDEVITVAHTFAATVEAILYCGARPVFVDVDPDTLVMDPGKVESAITERTASILPVHLYGNPADMEALKIIADKHEIPIVEDACQAHGALHRGKPVGGWGKAGVFSFYPTKNLGGLGEGGILTTDDEGLTEIVRKLRSHGETGRYLHEQLGFNYRMSAFQGAALRTKLPHLHGWNEERRQIASCYREGLAESGIKAVMETPDSEAVYHLFVVLLPERDRVQMKLKERGIDTSVHYPVPLNRQPPFESATRISGDLAVTESIANRVLSLPIYPGISEEAIDTVTENLKELAG